MKTLAVIIMVLSGVLFLMTLFKFKPPKLDFVENSDEEQEDLNDFKSLLSSLHLSLRMVALVLLVIGILLYFRVI